MSITLLNGDSVDSGDVHFDPDGYRFVTGDGTDITNQLTLVQMKTLGDAYGFDQNEYLRRLSASGGTDHVDAGDQHGPKETSDSSVTDSVLQNANEQVRSVIDYGKGVLSSTGSVVGTVAVNSSEAAKNVTKPLSLIAIAAIVLAVVFLVKK